MSTARTLFPWYCTCWDIMSTPASNHQDDHIFAGLRCCLPFRCPSAICIYKFKEYIPGTPSVLCFLGNFTPKTSNYCLKNRAFQWLSRYIYIYVYMCQHSQKGPERKKKTSNRTWPTTKNNNKTCQDTHCTCKYPNSCPLQTLRPPPKEMKLNSSCQGQTVWGRNPALHKSIYCIYKYIYI